MIKPLNCTFMALFAFGFIFYGCGLHIIQPYPIYPINPDGAAALTFTSDIFSKPFGTFGIFGSRWLRLSVYEMQPGDNSGKLESRYLGSTFITKEESAKTIHLSSKNRLGLRTEYYASVPGITTTCSPQLLLLTPKIGGIYTLMYTQYEENCKVNLTEIEEGVPAVAETSGVSSDERKDDQTPSNDPDRKSPKGAETEKQHETVSQTTE